MPYQELLPHPALRAFVDRFWVRDGHDVTHSAAPPQVLRILPDGCIDVLFGVAARDARVVGTMTRALIVPTSTAERTVAVRFQPGGATPFLRTSAHELTDRSVSVADLSLGWLPTTQIHEEADPRRGARLLQQALLQRLACAEQPSPLVVRATRALTGSTPPSVEELARRMGCSRQHLTREFRAHVGIGPKELGRVARMQRALALGERAPDSMSALARASGYFDEAHMDRDFRELVGQSPRRSLASGSIRPIESLFGVA